MRRKVRASIMPLLKSLEKDYIGDAGYADILEQALNSMRVSFNALDIRAKEMAEDFTKGLDTAHKAKTFKNIEKAIGINLQSVVAQEGIKDIMVASTQENVALIRSIPQEYLKKVENIVWRGTTEKSSSTSMISDLVKLGNITEKRAKLIARDQTAKLNAALTETRQQNLGIEEYIWRTSEDSRVRESHDEHNGKIFRWDSPPKNTGHPGQDIQCRCIPQPILRLE